MQEAIDKRASMGALGDVDKYAKFQMADAMPPRLLLTPKPNQTVIKLPVRVQSRLGPFKILEIFKPHPDVEVNIFEAVSS